MAPIKTLFRSTRPLFQSRAPFTSQTQHTFSRSAARSGRRYQSTAPVVDAAPNKSWLGAIWSSPVGPKTVHFWWVLPMLILHRFPTTIRPQKIVDHDQERTQANGMIYRAPVMKVYKNVHILCLNCAKSRPNCVETHVYSVKFEALYDES